MNHQWKRSYLNENHKIKNAVLRPLHQNEPSAATSAAEPRQTESSWPSRRYRTRYKKQPNSFGVPLPKNCLKRREDVMVSKKHQETQKFSIKFSNKERRTYQTNFAAMSINNGHKTKLHSNFALPLSLF